jgi:hypothetical protein
VIGAPSRLRLIRNVATLARIDETRDLSMEEKAARRKCKNAPMFDNIDEGFFLSFFFLSLFMAEEERTDSSWGVLVARREHRAATAAACLVALTLCVGMHVARPRGDVILGELHSAARQGKGSSTEPEVRERGGGASSATAETAAAAMKPVLQQQQQQQERVSVSALASKVLLEQSQEAAAAGKRFVEVILNITVDQKRQ